MGRKLSLWDVSASTQQDTPTAERIPFFWGIKPLCGKIVGTVFAARRHYL
jgi:hypothetical protein